MVVKSLDCGVFVRGMLAGWDTEAGTIVIGVIILGFVFGSADAVVLFKTVVG